MTQSLLSVMPLPDLAVAARSFERLARDYWRKAWEPELLFLPENVMWFQRQSASMYAEARRVRAEAIRRGQTPRSESSPQT